MIKGRHTVKRISLRYKINNTAAVDVDCFTGASGSGADTAAVNRKRSGLNTIAVVAFAVDRSGILRIAAAAGINAGGIAGVPEI